MSKTLDSHNKLGCWLRWCHSYPGSVLGKILYTSRQKQTSALQMHFKLSTAEATPARKLYSNDNRVPPLNLRLLLRKHRHY